MDSELEADELPIDGSCRGRRWGFWRRRRIQNAAGSVYIDRITLLLTPWFSIKLHRIYRPDEQRERHDHPWTFLSIVLWGSYVETVPCPGCPLHTDDVTHGRLRRIRLLNWKRAEDSHSIRECSRRPVWTLVFTVPARRTWGFYTDRGWVPFDQYEKLNDA